MGRRLVPETIPLKAVDSANPGWQTDKMETLRDTQEGRRKTQPNDDTTNGNTILKSHCHLPGQGCLGAGLSIPDSQVLAALDQDYVQGARGFMNGKGPFINSKTGQELGRLKC